MGDLEGATRAVLGQYRQSIEEAIMNERPIYFNRFYADPRPIYGPAVPICGDEPNGIEGPWCTLVRRHEGPHKQIESDVVISWEYTNEG